MLSTRVRCRSQSKAPPATELFWGAGKFSPRPWKHFPNMGSHLFDDVRIGPLLPSSRAWQQWEAGPGRAFVYHKGNLRCMFLIHLLPSHQHVGLKEAFDVQLTFCSFMGEREKGSHDSLAVNCPVWAKLEMIQDPKHPKNRGSSRHGDVLGMQTGLILIPKNAH